MSGHGNKEGGFGGPAPDRRRSPDEHRSQVVGLADALRSHTLSVHFEAERSGVVRELLRGCAGATAYALFLRSLLPVYEALERGLDRHARSPVVGAFAVRELYRSAAIRSDLSAIVGAGWETALAAVPGAARYAGRLVAAATGTGTLLIAHAYVRHLGDLSGGQILGRVLGRTLGLGGECLAFYAFADIDDLDAFKSSYRSAFDRVMPGAADREALLAEAVVAFALNIDLSNEVWDAAG